MLSSTLFGVFVLSVVLVLGNVFKEIFPLLVNSEVSIGFVLKFVALVMPFSLIFTIPWGILSAVLLVFGRISADNELVSLRMAGLSTPRICMPILIVAIGCSLFCYFINSVVAPKAKAEMKRELAKLAVENPLTLFRPDSVTKAIPGYIFYVSDKEGNTLKNLEVIQLKGKRAMHYITAPEAEAVSAPGEDTFRLVLKNATIEFRNPDDPDAIDKIQHGLTYGEYTFDIPLEKLRSKTRTHNASTKTTRTLLRERKSRIDENTGLEIPDNKMSGLRTEINRRYSFSLACVTLTLIGIPLGVTAQRRETTVGFALSLGIACCYFLLIIVADSMREDAKMYPHLVMWLPNVIFISLGVHLFWKLSKK